MADLHTWTGTPTDEETAMMEDLMRKFIFPNEAKTTEEITAFNKAVNYQIAHEKSQVLDYGQIPDGATYFKIGDFSLRFSAGTFNAGLNRKTICDAAYSVLLRAGLLYRGLPREVSE